MSSLALCIPAYQAAQHLPRLLISAQAQFIPFDEILVYDDASTDDTANVAENHGAQVIRGSRNVGCSAGKNILLSKAGTEWIHFHDADDMLLPNFTTLAHRWISKPDVSDAVLFDYEYRDNQTNEIIALSNFIDNDLREDPLRYAILHQINPFCGLYRKERLMSIGGYDVDPAILYNEDVAFHCKLALNGFSFSAEKEVSIVNFRMTKSMSSSNRLLCLKAHVEVMRRLSIAVGDRYPLEIKSKLWHAAKILASLNEWNEASNAIAIANTMGKKIPNDESFSFTILVSLFGVKKAFWLREQLIRLLKPGLRTS